MFDPFKDFKTNGYLRNVLKHKDAADVTLFEHNVFRANLSQALDFLSEKRIITYQDFLTIHRILFSDYYPWAGEDRRMTLPDLAVRKQGGSLFPSARMSARSRTWVGARGQQKIHERPTWGNNGVVRFWTSISRWERQNNTACSYGISVSSRILNSVGQYK